MTKIPKLTRRGFLNLGLASTTIVATASVAGFIGGAAGDGWEALKDFINPEPVPLSDALLSFVDGRMPEVSVGNYNQIAALEGKPLRPSQYIQISACSLISGLSASFPKIEVNLCGDIEAKPYSGINEAIFLGGPMANPELAKYLGFSLAKRDANTPEIKLPEVIPGEYKGRWAHVHGEVARGYYDGKRLFAKRYDRGEEVSRPIYKIRDLKTDEYLPIETNADGFLVNEYLQIIKLKNPAGFSQTFIWGLHGHSLQGFMGGNSQFEENLNELMSRVEGMENYQVVIPAPLEHSTGPIGNSTTASMDWDKALVEQLQ